MYSSFGPAQFSGAYAGACTGDAPCTREAAHHKPALQTGHVKIQKNQKEAPMKSPRSRACFSTFYYICLTKDVI
jgi:hypothetical protein